jgi:hypothetical protein
MTQVNPALTVNGIKESLGAMPQNNVLSGLTNIRGTDSISASLAGGGDLRELYNGFAGDAKQVQDAVYQGGMAQLRPDMDLARNRQESNLANRGISIDSDAYRGQQDRLDRAQNEQMNNLSLASVMAGNNRQNELFGQSLNRFNAAQGQRQQSLAEQLGLGQFEAGINQQQFGQNQQSFSNDMQLRQNSLAEALGLRQMQDQERDRQFSQRAGLLGIQQQAPNNAPIDLAGMVQSNYLSKLQNSQANNQALGSLLGTGMMAGATFFSDARLKENIVKVGEVGGLNVYEFNYKHLPDERWRGVMAQEVEHLGVVQEIDGFKAVDYSRLPVQMRRVS